MSDPVRWSATGSDASAEARALLQAARKPGALDAAARARHMAALAKISAGAAPVAAGAKVAAGSKLLGGAKAALVAKVLAAVGLATAVSVTAVQRYERHDDARAAHAPATAPTETGAAPDRTESNPTAPEAPPAGQERSPAPAEAAPAPAEAAPAPAEAAPVAREASPVAPRGVPAGAEPAPVDDSTATHGSSEPSQGRGHIASGAPVHPHAPSPAAEPVVVAAPAEPAAHLDPLDRERQLLEGAEGLLERDPEAALARVAEHARAFPDGQMAAEREYCAVRALARLGRTAEASQRAERLRSRHPDSPFAPLVRRYLTPTP